MGINGKKIRNKSDSTLSAIIFLLPHMKRISSILLNSLFGLLILTACSSADKSAAPVATIASPQPTITKPLPTPASPRDSIIWRELQVSMVQSELTEDFITEYGTSRIPSTGEKFMWAHIQLKNMGKKGMDVPPPEHFSVLYAATELKPVYGHRKDYADYMALDSMLFPNQEVDAWLRFDVPATADLKDLRFVFLPESSQVGASFSSPSYPYAEDHPTFVWQCKP
jgi:hypothetical protein